MDGIEAFSRVATRLHETALSSEEWPRALAAAVEFVKGDQAVILETDAQHADPTLAAAVAVDAEHARNCLSLDLGPSKPLILPNSPLGVVFHRTRFYSDRDFERTALYNQVMRPSNAFHALHARARRASSDFVVHLCRARRAGDFHASDSATLRLLLPHLATAMEIRDRLQIAANGYAGFVRALDRLETGVILTDGSARPCFVNSSAARTLAESDGLAAYDAGLAAATPAATQRLRETIAAVGADQGVASRRMRLERPSQRPPLLLTVTPIFRLGAVVAGAPAPRAAVFIGEIDARPALDATALIDAFRLTPRECDVAELLAHGRDLREIAAALGLGIGTVRHHLKRIFQKTGAGGQPKLVALLRSFADPWR